MIFQGRFERARKLQQEQIKGIERAYDDENLSDKLEKNDTLAMILSALIVFLIFRPLTGRADKQSVLHTSTAEHQKL